MERRQNSEKGQFSKSSSDQAAKSRFEIYFLSLFPEVFEPILSASLLGKAQSKGIVSFHSIQIRDFATDRHRTVDDTPYGGGAGMLMRADVLHAAWAHAMERAGVSSEVGDAGRRLRAEKKIVTILLSPQGSLFKQEVAKELAQYEKLVFICGHYEGVDERFIELCVDREVSVGDYVLTGGELPALVMADAVARLLPGVVGKEESIQQDSLEGGLLKYPQYTRPATFRGLEVPKILLSGNHAEIDRWREEQMRERTKRKRPDLDRKGFRLAGSQDS